MNRYAIGVFVLAVTVRVGLMVGHGTYRINPKRDYWSAGWETGRIARQLATGHGFAMEFDQFAPKPPKATAWLAPLYPYVYSGVFRVCGVYTVTSFVVIEGLQVLFAAWTAVLLLALGTELFSHRVGLVAAVMFSLWAPGALFCVWFIWGTTLLAALVLWLMLLAVRQKRQPRRWRVALMGLVAAAILLTEPAAGLFLPVLAVWLGVQRGRRGWGEAVTIGVIAAVLIAPWILRNHRVLGVWVPIKSNFGHELFIGNHPDATGFYRRTQLLVEKCFDRPTYERLAAADEAEMSRMLGAYAADYIADHPGGFATLTAKRMWWFWRFKLDAKWGKLINRQAVWKKLRWFDEVVQDLLLILAYLGAVLALWRRVGVGLPVLFLLTYPLAYYITHVDIPRYRYPVWPVVMLLAAWTLVEGRRAVTARRSACELRADDDASPASTQSGAGGRHAAK
ncbi:MAG: ArnT family glycosyltransferase [Phycisphaerae bacterium]